MSLEEMELVLLCAARQGRLRPQDDGLRFLQRQPLQGDSRNLEHMPIRLRPFPI
jgi:hypothetical protein